MMAQIPHAEPGLVCPLHRKDMSEVCHKCPWWQLLRGKDPQSTKDIDHWGCAVSFLPLLLVENAQVTRGNGAAIESFRNEMTSAATQITAAANVQRSRLLR
jgi:hypothetical protein